MLTFTLERRNIVCVMLWERSSIKNPYEDQFLGHLQNNLIVMRTNLIVIVFLKLMGYISSYLMDCLFGRRETWRYDDENTASWLLFKISWLWMCKTTTLIYPDRLSLLHLLYTAKDRERRMMLPWLGEFDNRESRDEGLLRIQKTKIGMYSKKRIVYTYLVCAS